MLAVQRLILICPADEAEKLLDDAEDGAPGHTTAFMAGWYEMCESDDLVAHFEDNDDVNVEVPDDRPAVPESRSRTPSTIITTSSSQTTTVRQSSTITEAVARSVTSPIVIYNVPPLTTKIQGTAHDRAQEQAEHTEEEQADVFTAVQNLDVDKDLEMDAVDAMNIAKKNALSPILPPLLPDLLRLPCLAVNLGTVGQTNVYQRLGGIRSDPATLLPCHPLPAHHVGPRQAEPGQKHCQEECLEPWDEHQVGVKAEVDEIDSKEEV